MRDVRACNSVTTPHFPVLCFFSQNKHFIKDELVIKDAAVIRFSLLANPTCVQKPKVPGSSPATSYVQRWALCSHRLANV